MKFEIEKERYGDFKEYLARKLTKETGKSYIAEDIFVNDKDMHDNLKNYYPTDEIPYKYIFSNTFFEDYKGHLKNVEYIYGDAMFDGSKLTNLGSLKTVCGCASFYDSLQIESLGNLRYVGEDLYLGENIKDLGNLQTVGGNLYLNGAKLSNLGNLHVIGGNTNFGYSYITNLGKLKKIVGNANFAGALVDDLGELKIVGGNAMFKNSDITSLKNLEYVGDNLDLINSKVEDLGNLKYVGRKIYLSNKQKELFKDKIYKDEKGFYHFRNDPNYVLVDDDKEL